MKVNLIPIGNPRRNEQSVQKVADSIEEFGWQQPIVVDDQFVVIAGHTRLKAAEHLGLEKVPVHVAHGLTEAQARAYRLMDNRSHEDSKWEEELLKVELQALQDLDFETKLTGFDCGEIDRLLLGRTGLTDPDAAPPTPKKAKTQPGDLWLLGNHKILCGDATNPDHVKRLLGRAKPHLMVTDPPYGVNYDPTWRKESPGQATGKVLNDDRADWREAWKLFPGSVAYVWHGGLQKLEVVDSLLECGFRQRSEIIWVKQRPVFSRGHYHWQHEDCLYAAKEDDEDHWQFVTEHDVAAYLVQEGETAEWNGGRKQSTVWFIEHLKNDTGHSTQKPVECMRRPIVNNSQTGDYIYEPFAGSGTTLIAAEMTGRRCLAMELNPEYVDVVIQRWEEFTGKKAKHGKAPAKSTAKKSGGQRKRRS